MLACMYRCQKSEAIKFISKLGTCTVLGIHINLISTISYLVDIQYIEHSYVNIIYSSNLSRDTKLN